MLCINDILILLIFFSAEPDSTPRPIMDFNRIYDCGLLIVCDCDGGADCRDNDDSLQSAVKDSQPSYTEHQWEDKLFYKNLLLSSISSELMWDIQVKI